MTKKKIIKKLRELGVEFSSKKTKEELEELLLAAGTISEEEMIKRAEEEIEKLEESPLEEVCEEEYNEEQEQEEVNVAKVKEDIYAGKKVLSRKKIKINGIERESILLESLENIIL